MSLLLAIALAIPPQIDPLQYLPPPPRPVVCTADMLSFPPIALPFDTPQTLRYADADSHTLQEIKIPPGYLVSECEFVKITNQRIEAQRMRVELDAITDLRRKEFELWRLAETQYQTELNRYRNPTWFERNRLSIGMLIGTVATGVVLATTASLIR